MQRLPPQLVHDGFDDFRMAMPDVENTETAETVDVFAAADVAIRIRPGVGPFDDGLGAFDGAGFAILEKTGVDMLAKCVDCLARDPARLVRSDLRQRDEVEHSLRVFECLARSVVANVVTGHDYE